MYRHFDNLSREDQKLCIGCLFGIKKLIAHHDNWTKNAFARNSKGEGCESLKIDAVCFCLSGAITRSLTYSESPLDPGANRALLWPPIRELLIGLIDNPSEPLPTVFFSEITRFNDNYWTEHSDVINLLNSAIKKTARRYRERWKED